MQDPYTALMGTQQRQDPFKSYSNPSRGNGTGLPPNTTSPSSYYGMPYGAPSYGNHNQDSYQHSMAVASALGQDYAPLPAHMVTPNSINPGNNGLSRYNPTTHTITHSQTSPPPTGSSMGRNMSDISSPPASSRISLSSDGKPYSEMSPDGKQFSEIGSSPTPSESNSMKLKHDNGSNSSDSDKRDNTDEDSSGVPPKKRLHTVPPEQRDMMYWEKRKKNNESAKRSRESRRMKEEQIALRVVYLEQENLQLRTEVSLLKSEIEKLRCMLYNS